MLHILTATVDMADRHQLQESVCIVLLLNLFSLNIAEADLYSHSLQTLT